MLANLIVSLLFDVLVCVAFTVPVCVFTAATVECPTCRTQHELPAKGVNGFSTNFTVTNLVGLLNLHGNKKEGSAKAAQILRCENEIDDNQAAAKCLDCDFYLCEDCTVIHKKHRVSRHHKIATIAELKEGGVKKMLEQKRHCLEHEGEELKLYCRTCQAVICRDCAIVTHKQHDYTFVKDAREEITKKMEGLVITVKKKEAEYQDILKTLHIASDAEQKKLIAHKARVKKAFDDHISKLHAQITALENYRASLLESLGKVSGTHIKQISSEKESVELFCTQITSGLALTKQLISSASNTDLAIMSGQVIRQLGVLSQYQPTQTIRNSQWELQLPKENLLSSAVFSNVSVAVSDLADPALLGKNTFHVRAEGFPSAFPTKPEVAVTLCSGKSCLVNVKQIKESLWSVDYFILFYPQLEMIECSEDQDIFLAPVVVSVAVCGVQAKNSPFQLQCKKAIAIGTRVEDKISSQLQGTVSKPVMSSPVSSKQGKKKRSVQLVPTAWVAWNDGTTEEEQLANLKILTE